MDDNVNKTNLVSAKSFRDELQQQILEKTFPKLDDSTINEINKRIEDTSIEDDNMEEVPGNKAKPTNKRPKNIKKILVTLGLAVGILSSALLIGIGVKDTIDDNKTLNTAIEETISVLHENDYHIDNYDQLDPNIKYLYKFAVWEDAASKGIDKEQALKDFLMENEKIPDNYYDYDRNDPEVNIRHEEIISTEVTNFTNNGVSNNVKNEIIEMTENGELSQALVGSSNAKSGRSL